MKTVFSLTKALSKNPLEGIQAVFFKERNMEKEYTPSKTTYSTREATEMG